MKTPDEGELAVWGLLNAFSASRATNRCYEGEGSGFSVSVWLGVSQAPAGSPVGVKRNSLSTEAADTARTPIYPCKSGM